MNKKSTVLLLPFQAYSLAVLLGLLFYRTEYGHTTAPPLFMFFYWNCIVSSFIWLIGAAVQAFNGLRTIACINAILALAAIFAAAHLLPYLAN